MKLSEITDFAEGWSQKYKNSIDCNHPKGFSQRNHCAGKKKHAKDTMVKEDFPRPGVSSGVAKKLKSDAKIKTKEMTLGEILKTVKGIPYVDYVIKDYDDNDYSWDVMKKVKEYADHLLLHPRTIANLPPILVIDGQLNDGAHRISTLNLLQKRMDPDNPFWKQVKLKVNFAKADDVEPDANENTVNRK